MVLPQSLTRAKIGDVIKCIPAGCIELNKCFYAIITEKNEKICEIDNGEKRLLYLISNWKAYFNDILFVHSNQLLLKTTNSPEVLLFLVDERDNILNYNIKIPVKNPYFRADQGCI